MELYQKLHKIHAQGNDFIIIPPALHASFLSHNSKKSIAHRRFGIGADQLFFITIDEKNHTWSSTIYNQDGTKAAICLNGVYASACLIHDHFPTIKSWDIHIDTIKLSSSLITNKPSISIPKNFSTQLRPISLQKIGITEPSHYVHTANEHIILQTNTIDTYPLAQKALDITKLYPQGINVSCFQATQNNLYIRTYERGCGLTYSCGSAGLAACIVHWEKHPLIKAITVHHPGGCNYYTKTTEGTIKIQGTYGYIATINYSNHPHQETPQAQLATQYQIEIAQNTEVF